ncbi:MULTISPECIES: tyrosine recombinase XerC [unclassified Cryobacterium]|uniref:site-specific integrase n=1 Tax=unclassified Cryobacterium TaxID=2649013 RepID=UPI00141A8FB6|nr:MULTISPECIES: tyrosine-type recombinase/integrase [unclassified Cryobacterium]
MERTGPTKASAEQRLKDAVKGRASSGDADLNSETTIEALMHTWWPWKLETTKLSEGSKGNYADVINRIIVPGLGKVKLREATTGRMDRWLVKERRTRSGQAEIARTLLNQAFTFAAQRDAVTGNPIANVSKPITTKPVPRALTTDELVSLRDAVRGMRQNTWLADAFEAQLGLAGRIGEVAALMVEDLDLDHAVSPRVHIVATVITPNGKKHSRQLHTKDGEDGRRTVIIHDWLVDILRNRALLAGPSGLLFASRNDTLLDPHNMRESWRNIRDGARLGWMKPHHLRKTTLSKIAEVFDLETASKFADHKGTDVTTRYYIERAVVAGPDVRTAFTDLAPKPHLRLVEKAL